MMQKKGQVGEVIGVIILISVLVLGGIGSYKIISDNRYIGNIGTHLVYDLKYCDVSDISKDKILSFTNKEEAYKNGFKDAECNR